MPWQFGFSSGAREKPAAVNGAGDPGAQVGNHMLMLRRLAGSFSDLGGGLVRDAFGVVWDRRLDADVGLPSGDVLPGPTLRGLVLPDPADPRFFADFEQQIVGGGDRSASSRQASRCMSAPGPCAAMRPCSWTSSSTWTCGCRTTGGV